MCGVDADQPQTTWPLAFSSENLQSYNTVDCSIIINLVVCCNCCWYPAHTCTQSWFTVHIISGSRVI